MIAVDLLAADLARLADGAAAVTGATGAGADRLHVDVIDGHFAPVLTVGLPVIRSVLAHTPVPLDCHLEIDDPDRWAIGYAEAGVHDVSVQAEAARDPVGIAADLHRAGARAGLALAPGTPLTPHLRALEHFDILLLMTAPGGHGRTRAAADALRTVRAARRVVEAGHLAVEIGICGVDRQTIAAFARAGANRFVVGDAVYGAPDPLGAVQDLRARVLQATRRR
jgi:ribulose-phosphate 3-epimerase